MRSVGSRCPAIHRYGRGAVLYRRPGRQNADRRRIARQLAPPRTWMTVAPAASLSRSLRSLPLASLGDSPALRRGLAVASGEGERVRLGPCCSRGQPTTDHEKRPIAERKARSGSCRSVAGMRAAYVASETFGSSRERPATKHPRARGFLLAPTHTARLTSSDCLGAAARPKSGRSRPRIREPGSAQVHGQTGMWRRRRRRLRCRRGCHNERHDVGDDDTDDDQRLDLGPGVRRQQRREHDR